MFKTLIEPFRIKTVEPIRRTTPDERRAALAAAGNNVFLLKADDVLIDLLTDSGTGAMSAAQWGAIMQGTSPTPAAAPSFASAKAVRTSPISSTSSPPIRAGRPSGSCSRQRLKPGDVVPNNTHFDTTRANVEVMGARPWTSSSPKGIPSLIHPFKGNMDLARLERTLSEDGHKVPLVMVTVTNNTGGGQPVSLENLRGIRALCDKYGQALLPRRLPLRRERVLHQDPRARAVGPRAPRRSPKRCSRLADGAPCRQEGRPGQHRRLPGHERRRLAEQCRNLLILTEGFPTYGGLAGYDLEAVAQGLEEVVEEDYLRYRIRSTEYWASAGGRGSAGDPLPAGGHAVYIDARALLPHIAAPRVPGHRDRQRALSSRRGIRGVEIGTVMFGQQPDGREVPAMDLVRLAIPRRVYTQSHMDYVVEAVRERSSGAGVWCTAPRRCGTSPRPSSR
jgi:tyrosine phenol-lyase